MSRDFPSSSHASVKHSLSSSPSMSSLFAEDVIKASLTQVKEDLQLKLLSNLSSMKDGKQSASSASSSGCGQSTFYSSSRGNSRGSKHSTSPLPACCKVSFDSKTLRSPTPKKSFRK